MRLAPVSLRSRATLACDVRRKQFDLGRRERFALCGAFTLDAAHDDLAYAHGLGAVQPIVISEIRSTERWIAARIGAVAHGTALSKLLFAAFREPRWRLVGG